jgi:hypothetical protein
MLQEEGLPPEKTVERTLEEDFNADVTILANSLNLDKMDIGRIKDRMSTLRKRREKRRKSSKRWRKQRLRRPPIRVNWTQQPS